MAEVVMLTCVTIIGIYGASFFSTTENWINTIHVSEIAVVLAGVTLVYSFITYLWAPEKPSTIPSLIDLLFLAATTAALIVEGGGAQSPFVALWMILAIFAGVFSIYAIIPMLSACIAYIVMLVQSGSWLPSDVATIVLAGILPLIASFLLWHRHASRQISTGDRAYRELASELSQVAGKAEVVINAIADGVIAVDNQGVIQLINPAAQQIIGWGKQDALALNYKSVLQLRDNDGNELKPNEDPVATVLASNQEIQRDDLTVMTQANKKLLTSLVVSPVGQPGSGVIVVFRDITSAKAEEHAQAEFISTASHEMRTPVASIEGYLGLALNPQTASIDAKARDFIEKAHQSAEHLGRLFQDLLDVSKADDGRLTSHPKVIDVVDMVGDIAEGLEPKAKEKGLTVVFKPAPTTEVERNERRLNPVYYTNVDPDHFREVTANLIENAIKYTLTGSVIIDVTGDTNTVVVSVTDSGIGIPAEDVPHLFQKFYRVDNTATREIGGTGLGLYLCRRLVETMGGRIWVESEFEKGSTFFVELPRLESAEATRMIEAAAMVPIAQTTPSSVEPVQVQPATEQPPLQQTPDPLPPQATPVSSEQTPPAVSAQPPASEQPLYHEAVTQPTTQPINTPLTTIENNREQYARDQRSSVMRIPVRDHSSTQE